MVLVGSGAGWGNQQAESAAGPAPVVGLLKSGLPKSPPSCLSPLSFPTPLLQSCKSSVRKSGDVCVASSHVGKVEAAGSEKVTCNPGERGGLAGMKSLEVTAEQHEASPHVAFQHRLLSARALAVPGANACGLVGFCLRARLTCVLLACSKLGRLG